MPCYAVLCYTMLILSRPGLVLRGGRLSVKKTKPEGDSVGGESVPSTYIHIYIYIYMYMYISLSLSLYIYISYEWTVFETLRKQCSFHWTCSFLLVQKIRFRSENPVQVRKSGSEDQLRIIRSIHLNIQVFAK